jgi:hypothetical protein
MALLKITVNQMIKKLQKLEKEVPRGTPIVVNLAEFRDLGEEYTHWNVHDIKTEIVPYVNEGDEGNYTDKVVVSII